MSLFAVERKAGPAWAAGGIFDQPGVDEHAAFMNALAQEGSLLFGGPVAGTEHGRVRVLLVFDGESEAEIQRRLADDPWVRSGQLGDATVEPWTLLVGAERLAPAPMA